MQKPIFVFFAISQNRTRCVIKLNKILISYCLRRQKNFAGQFQESLSTLSDLNFADLSVSSVHNYHKLLELNFLGQLLGLPTLHSITTELGLSNALQTSKRKIDKSLTMSGIAKLYTCLFQKELERFFLSQIQKDSSIWSKTLVTAVLDDSVFRQWLNANIEAGSAYGKFFSGQYHTAVYGYDVLLMGFSIAGVFYPFSFEFIRKDDHKKSQKRAKVAQKLLKKWQQWQGELKAKGIILPKIQLSVDNGFNDMALADAAQKANLNFISVPKKSHKIIYKNKEISLKNLIEKEFLEEEKQHIEVQKDLPDAEKTAFQKRLRVSYKAKNREITLLLFRLNASNKVSAIYSLDKNIFTKTLRRHWFQRTYIEQFFKLLKHTLKIQEARTKGEEGFHNKIYQFMFVALQCQKLIKYLRKTCQEFKQKGLKSLQRALVRDRDILELLQSKATKKYHRTM